MKALHINNTKCLQRSSNDTNTLLYQCAKINEEDEYSNKGNTKRSVSLEVPSKRLSLLNGLPLNSRENQEVLIKKLQDILHQDRNFLSRNSDIQGQTLLDAVNSKYFYYTRTKGLFRTCFPKERPLTVKLYLSPVETYCMNINYYIPDENNETKDFTDDAWTRLHMGRSMIALFIISFFSVFAAFCTGVTGCWRRSPGNITATAILMLLACLLSAGAMGLWHGVEYYEKEKQVGEEFYQQWSTLLQDNSTIYYDWGFALGWLGVFSCLGGSLLFFFGSCCLQAEKDREQLDNVQYIVPVYPQKQQYAYAGYPVPPQPYSGPYYTTGSAYGPYNY